MHFRFGHALYANFLLIFIFLAHICNLFGYLLFLSLFAPFLGVGAGGEEQKASAISVFHLPWLAFIMTILFVGILYYYDPTFYNIFWSFMLEVLWACLQKQI